MPGASRAGESETALAGVLYAEGVVEAPPQDVEEVLRRAPLREGVIQRDAGSGEALEEATRGVLLPLLAVSVLAAREGSRVEADQGEPAGVSRRPSERAHCVGGRCGVLGPCEQRPVRTGERHRPM